jgi:hypothetical protein
MATYPRAPSRLGLLRQVEPFAETEVGRLAGDLPGDRCEMTLGLASIRLVGSSELGVSGAAASTVGMTSRQQPRRINSHVPPLQLTESPSLLVECGLTSVSAARLIIASAADGCKRRLGRDV